MKNSKRNYIRKKKTYNKSMALVHQTLELIGLVKNTKIPPSELDQLAKQHADRIEAVCWDPRNKITDDVYQQIVIQKTRELCNMLINKYAPQVNTISLLIQIHGKNLLQNIPPKENPKQEIKSQAPVNHLPIPIFIPNNSNDYLLNNNIISEIDKGNNFFPPINDDFQLKPLLRPESPNFVTNFINHENTNDPLNVDFNINDNFIQTDFV